MKYSGATSGGVRLYLHWGTILCVSIIGILYCNYGNYFHKISTFEKGQKVVLT